MQGHVAKHLMSRIPQSVFRALFRIPEANKAACSGLKRLSCLKLHVHCVLDNFRKTRVLKKLLGKQRSLTDIHLPSVSFGFEVHTRECREEKIDEK